MVFKWFLYKDENVEGPLTTEDVQDRLQAGKLNASYMIWAKGNETWCSVAQWNPDSVVQEFTQTQVVQKEAPAEAWHYALNGQSFGPMPRTRLMEELKRVDTLGP